MGACWSSQIKAENPFHLTLGSILEVDGEGKDSIGSKSVPHTLRTEGQILEASNVKSFSFNDMKMATRNFRADSVVGEGGFGCVFKGWINERDLKAAKPGTGMVIAVKKLNHEGYQGHQEWLAEINYLGQLRHPNLVKLIGYCLENEQRLLVYEFMHRGSLENHLFRRNSYFQPLSWSLRMKVALGAAMGLSFLHNHEVIYRDFKTSNILLDSHYCAKLSDFGLAKDGPVGDQSHVSTRVMGTYGYAAPEYLATGHLTTKSDVYSFGVVLLEILSGHRVLDKNHLSGEHKITEWLKICEGGGPKALAIVDPRIQGQYSANAAHRVVSLAMLCVARDPQQRPVMKEVVPVLEQLQEGPNSEGSQGMHGQRFGQSASNGVKYRHKSTNGLPRGKGNIPRGKGASFPRPSPSPRNF